jgi:hypothetical protein
MAENFRDTHYGEVFGINYDVTSGGAHLLATDTKKINRSGCGAGALACDDCRSRRPALRGDSRPRLSNLECSAQRLNQLRPIHFSRRLARRSQYSHASIVNSVFIKTDRLSLRTLRGATK